MRHSTADPGGNRLGEEVVAAGPAIAGHDHHITVVQGWVGGRIEGRCRVEHDGASRNRAITLQAQQTDIPGLALKGLTSPAAITAEARGLLERTLCRPGAFTSPTTVTPMVSGAKLEAAVRINTSLG